MALTQLARAFRGRKRTEIGPLFLTNQIKRTCNKTGEYDLINLRKERCFNLTSVGPNLVNPVRPGMNHLHFRSNNSRLKDVKEWEEILKIPQSIATHIYSSATYKKKVSKDPLLDVYAYLGP